MLAPGRLQFDPPTAFVVLAVYLERYPNPTDALNHGGSECSEHPFRVAC